MADDSAPVTHVTVAPPSTAATFVAQLNWVSLGKAVAMAAVGAAIFWMEMTGHADKGTFLNYVALPVMGFMGLHTAATRMQGVSPNA